MPVHLQRVVATELGSSIEIVAERNTILEMRSKS
jgi:predicted nucleotidyltransferase